MPLHSRTIFAGPQKCRRNRILETARDAVSGEKDDTLDGGPALEAKADAVSGEERGGENTEE